MENNQILSEENDFQGKFFSPTQIVLGTIIGGLVSGIYFMAKNYESIGNTKKRNMTYMIGLFFIIVLTSLLLYFDVKTSGSALAVGLAAGLSAYTRTFLQENKIAILGNFFPSIENEDKRQSNWYVLSGILIGIIAGLFISLIIGFTFIALSIDIS